MTSGKVKFLLKFFCPMLFLSKGRYTSSAVYLGKEKKTVKPTQAITVALLCFNDWLLEDVFLYEKQQGMLSGKGKAFSLWQSK